MLARLPADAEPSTRLRGPTPATARFRCPADGRVAVSRRSTPALRRLVPARMCGALERHGSRVIVPTRSPRSGSYSHVSTDRCGFGHSRPRAGAYALNGPAIGYDVWPTKRKSPCRSAGRQDRSAARWSAYQVSTEPFTAERPHHAPSGRSRGSARHRMGGGHRERTSAIPGLHAAISSIRACSPDPPD